MYVTYSELFQFCAVMIGVATLCVTVAVNIKKK
nr:MAG TPA: Putative Holin-like Toxin (Hol-Tox) [Caudoviricetes sp.]